MKISIFDPENLSKITSNIDKEALKQLAIYRMHKEEEKMEKVDLDEIMNFRSFLNLERLLVRNMIMSSSYHSISHIALRDVPVSLPAKEEKSLIKKGYMKSAQSIDDKPLWFGDIVSSIRSGM